MKKQFILALLFIFIVGGLFSGCSKNTNLNKTKINLEPKESCVEEISKQIFLEASFKNLKSIYDKELQDSILNEDNDKLIGYYFSFENTNKLNHYELALVENYKDRVTSVQHFQVNKKNGEICVYDIVDNTCEQKIKTDKKYLKFFNKNCKNLKSENLQKDQIKNTNEDSIEIHAFGEEPFWSFIIKNDILTLSTPTEEQTHQVIVEKRGDTYNIAAEVLIIFLTREECIDGGIGESHEYSVSLSYEPEKVVYGCADVISF
ncbi:MAG: hypothetical protein M0P94_03055 [Candidatus Absconditabacterales bacterium]|nr:hypothetical protein [Candidatus Absconditabacterales bacterium]